MRDVYESICGRTSGKLTIRGEVRERLTTRIVVLFVLVHFLLHRTCQAQHESVRTSAEFSGSLTMQHARSSSQLTYTPSALADNADD